MPKKKSANWQRKSGKDEEGGLNEAGRKSYEPGESRFGFEAACLEGRSQAVAEGGG